MGDPDKTRTQRGKEACVRGYKRGRKGIVYVITSDKIIQAVLTGSVTSIIFSFNEGVAAYLQRAFVGATAIYVPVKFIAVFGALVTFIVTYYADQHTEAWRSYVRDVTGEEPSTDTASNDDVTGESKE